MAFQEFSQVSARRRAERQEKLRKRLTIAAVVIVVLLIIIAAGVFAIVYISERSGSSKSSQQEVKPKKDKSQRADRIKMICNPTDYQSVCESSLKKVLKNNASSTNPKDALRASIVVTLDEVENVLNQTSKFRFENKEEQGAYEDCKLLLQDAKEELQDSISTVSDKDVEMLPSKADDLNNWLSAVISYQQTCIDGFPEGKSKTKMQKTLGNTKILTSNALAIVAEVSSILSTLQLSGGNKRRLLQATSTSTSSSTSTSTSLGEDGLPNWMSHEDRRMLKARSVNLKPNAVVAKDGSGDFKTISDALAKIPKKYTGRYVIYVKAGVYDETVIVTKDMVNVTMYGDGSMKSIVTGSKNFVDGIRTFQTATFAALGEGFTAMAMGFRNTAGPEKHQAVALRVQADRSVFINCRMEGYQDTLYVQTHRQFYRSCVIAGTIDFIFGDASAILQNCMIMVRKPLDNQQNTVTAQGRADKRETTALVIQNSRILPDDKLVPDRTKIKSYLGRPWKEYSRTIIMESTISDVIQPDGWLPWDGDFALNTLFYAEYNNRGPGAKLTARVKWPGFKVIKKDEADKFTVGTFLETNWIQASGAPFRQGLYN
ncbi:PREDICTED: putative pectinesterase/pectinesterase inhibitor 45 [Nelumbo nucifera]|uniref:Pectinesterase n=1 Tax=Nelumbo nucifera TaxID=4432 RepID=A0A1U8B000_NELNU|nr:PREDICTED: putative pectinesterase/pectinesterase inhibitor 45 [Nelumbo nucifera]